MQKKGSIKLLLKVGCLHNGTAWLSGDVTVVCAKIGTAAFTSRCEVQPKSSGMHVLKGHVLLHVMPMPRLASDAHAVAWSLQVSNMPLYGKCLVALAALLFASAHT